MRKFISLLLVAAFLFSMFIFPENLSADASTYVTEAISDVTESTTSEEKTIFSISDMGLVDGDAIPSNPAPGQFGMFSGIQGDVIFRSNADGEYIQINKSSSAPAYTPSIGFMLPEEEYDTLVVEFEFILDDENEAITASWDSPPRNMYFRGDNGFFSGLTKGTSGFADFSDGISTWLLTTGAVRGIPNMWGNQAHVSRVAPRNDAGGYAYEPNPNPGAFPPHPGDWITYRYTIRATEDGYEYTIQVGSQSWSNPAGALFEGEFDRFAMAFGDNWSGAQDIMINIRNLTVSLETDSENDTPPNGTPKDGVFSVDFSDLDSGSLLPPVTPGNFGRVNGNVRYISEDGKSFIRIIDDEQPPSGSDYQNTFGFMFPDNMSPVVTVEYKIRVHEGGQSGTPFYFDPAAWLDMGYAVSKVLEDGSMTFDSFGEHGFLLLNYEGRLLAPGVGWPSRELLSGQQGDYLPDDRWIPIKLIWDRATGDHWLFAEGEQDAWVHNLQVSSTGANDLFDLFYISFKKWGNPMSAVVDVKDVTVSFGRDAPYIPTDEAENPFVPCEDTLVWHLNDQLTQVAQLPVFDPDINEIFSAHVTGNGAVNFKYDEEDRQYVELDFSGSGPSSAAIVFNLPQSYAFGKLYFFYRMSMPPDINWNPSYWHTAGFGLGFPNPQSTNGLIIQHSSAAMNWTTGTAFQNDGRWYSYLIEVDLNEETMTAHFFRPGMLEPERAHRSIDLGANFDGLDTFFISTYSSPFCTGTLSIRDLMIAYEPSVRGREHLSFTPLDREYMTTRTPEFSWKATMAVEYTLEVSTSADFEYPVISEKFGFAPLSRVRWIYDTVKYEPLAYNTTYFWRILYDYGDGDLEYGAVSSFTTEIPKREDGIYTPGIGGLSALIEGAWLNRDNHVAGNTDDNAARHNALVLQGLINMAGRYGGGTVQIPSGTYRLRTDVSRFAQSILNIDYDNITLTGSGRDGEDATILQTSSAWDPPNLVFRNAGITIVGTPQSSIHPRKHIEISNFVLDGGRGFTSARGDWGFDPTVDYSWDIGHQGVIVNRDRFVTHVLLDNLLIRRFSGEQLYQGGLNTGYLEVRNVISIDTNAQTFNLHAAYLLVHDSQFGSMDTQCRFWIEYCNRATHLHYIMPPRPDSFSDPRFDVKDTAIWTNNRFYRAMNSSEGVALAQGDRTVYRKFFENNVFDNTDGGPGWAFLIMGAIYGPTHIQNNVFRNFSNGILSFADGGGISPPNWFRNENVFITGNVFYNINGPIVNFSQNGWHQTVLEVRNNEFTGRYPTTPSFRLGGPGVGNIVSGIVVEGNTFNNCLTPEERGSFTGDMPLFKNNIYTDSVTPNTDGGIAILTADNTEVRPFFEKVLIRAETSVTVSMRVEKRGGLDTYVNGQLVSLIGDAGSADVTFSPDGAGYAVPYEITVKSGDVLTFRFNASDRIWEFVSFVAAPELCDDCDAYPCECVVTPPTVFSGTSPRLMNALLAQGNVELTTPGSGGYGISRGSLLEIPEGRTLYVSTRLNVRHDAVLRIEGTVVVLEGGRINIDGSRAGGGTIVIASGGRLINYGYVESVSRSFIFNYGTITNNGSTGNLGRFEIRTGTTLINAGTIDGNRALNIHRNAIRELS